MQKSMHAGRNPDMDDLPTGWAEKAKKPLGALAIDPRIEFFLDTVINANRPLAGRRFGEPNRRPVGAISSRVYRSVVYTML